MFQKLTKLKRSKQTIYASIQVFKIVDRFIGELASVFHQHIVDFGVQTALNVGIFRNFIQTKRNGARCRLESGQEKHKTLRGDLFDGQRFAVSM